MKKNYAFILGTRPEVIKLSPIYNFFKKKKLFNVTTFFTGQHNDIGFELISYFKLGNLRKKKKLDKVKSLNEKMASISIELQKYLLKKNITGIFVLGDTLTAMIAAISAFNLKIKIFYIESGLRTYDYLEPWPEEGYRRLISSIADLHFCPTNENKKNLLRENIKTKNICVCGNPAIDALIDVLKRNKKSKYKIENNIIKKGYQLNKKEFVLITIHRRENFGERFENICKIIKKLSFKYQKYDFVITLHPNPYVNSTIKKFLSNIKNIFLINPLIYPEFIYLLNKSKIILSDSGGIQEELPTLKKYLILLREKTERKETVKLGYTFIAGSSEKKILYLFKKLIRKTKYNKKFVKNPFGDGNSSKKIFDFIKKYEKS